MGNRVVKILTVDDNRDNLVTLKALIKDVFPEALVLTALRGQQGLELAAAEDPDVILLDIILPGMDGFEVCTRLKADKKLRDIPVVFVTALKGDKENRIKALECGAEAFLSKPINESELTAQIRAMLKIRAANLQKEETLRDSEKKYRTLFESAAGAILLFTEGRWVDCNEKALNVFGCTREQIIGEHFIKFSPLKQPDGRSSDEEAIKKIDLAYSTEPQLFEWVHCRADGTLFPAEVSLKCVDLEGKPYIQAIILDITDRKQAEIAIKESEEKHRLLITQMTQGLAVYEVVLDEAGSVIDYRFIDSNQAFERLTGLKREDIIGKTLLEVLPKAEHSRIQKYGHVAMTGEPLFFEDYSEELGKYFEIVAYSPKPKQFATIFSDITERKKIEVQLQQNMDDLLESQCIAHIGTWRLNLATNQVVWSKELYRMYGFDPTIPPPPYTEHMKLFTPESWDKLSTSLEYTRTSGTPYELELETVTIDGYNGWMWVRGEAVKDSNGNIISLWGAAQDITARKNMEHQLFKEKEQFKTTLLSVGDGVISTDVQGNVLIMNKISEQLTGWTQEEAIGKPVVEVFYIINEFTRERCENSVQKVLETGDIIGLANHTLLISKDGTERPIEDSTGPIKDEQGNITGVVLVFRDFTEKKKSQDEIKYISFHDHLTGLYNRRFFEAELSRLDTKRNWPLTIVMGDVNGLKLINDSFGHATGDQLLVKTAEAIKNGSRADDIIARIGGDEFVILLPKTDGFEAAQLIKRIKGLLKKEKVGDIEISISFGYESKRSEADEVEAIFKKAEDTMYHNKLFEGPSIRGKVIDNIVDALNKKSKREQAHSKRVSALCERMGIALGLKEHKIKELKALGLLHDIGKIAVADHILNKTTELTASEWVEMKRHSEIGYRILSTANDMSEIAEYVLPHHERWDGKGYPKGLKGEDIPFESRIIAIADAYDAMTSERSYKSHLTKDVVLAELRNNAGTQFDPELVRVFIDKCLYENGKRVQMRSSEIE